MNFKRVFIFMIALGVFLALLAVAVPAFAYDPDRGLPDSTASELFDAAVAAPASPASPARVACFSGVGGEPTQEKIFSGWTDRQIVYMQCGRVVAKVGGGGCGCRAGGWRYVNECPKSAPVYVNLPCPRK